MIRFEKSLRVNLKEILSVILVPQYIHSFVDWKRVTRALQGAVWPTLIKVQGKIFLFVFSFFNRFAINKPIQ